jgi:hypothetical protein
MTPGTMTAARQPHFAAAMPVIAPASEAPKHQVARLMLMTRPRSRAGQVSATSIEPNAHSPLKAKPTIERAAMNMTKVGDKATIGINSEKSAILIANNVRRPKRSASHGQKYNPTIVAISAICNPDR